MRVLAIALVILSCTGAAAQDYTFRVLVNEGRNEVRNGSQWIPVKAGAKLQSADELRVTPNGYVGLVHVSGIPHEVKASGTYRIADLAAKVKGGTSVLNKYTDFILSSSEKGGNSLTATGAVHRGPNEIIVFLPDPKQAIVFNEKISIAWAKDPKTEVYVLRVNSMFGDELDRMEVRDTTAVLDLGSPKLAREDNILVEVSSKSDKERVSESFMLKRISDADKERIKSSLAHIAAQTNDQTALNNLFLASFFEDNKLLIDAATAYQEAIRLAPNVPYFQDAFNEFLARNGLNTK